MILMEFLDYFLNYFNTMNQQRYQTNLYRILFAIATLLITYFATTSRIYPVVETFSDKFNHLVAFIVLALLADFSFPESSFSYTKISMLFGYGILIEVVQYFLPNRIFSLYDVAADLAGLVVYAVCLPYIKKTPVLRSRWD